MTEGKSDATGPTGDVEYDAEALEKAKERMHVDDGGEKHDPDPPGGHDPEALDDAARKMGTSD